MACKLFAWPLPVATAVEILKRTNIFADTGVYYAGHPTPQIAAFNVVMDQADAVALFEDVRRTGGVVGQLYSLCAFQLLDEVRSRVLAAELRASESLVFTQFGCIGTREAVKDVVDSIEEDTTGRFYREARDRTYAYFGEPANICMQATAGSDRVTIP